MKSSEIGGQLTFRYDVQTNQRLHESKKDAVAMKMIALAAGVCFGVLLPRTASALYGNPGGSSEIIACSGHGFGPIHVSGQYNDFSRRTYATIYKWPRPLGAPKNWWTYANPGTNTDPCKYWFFGEVAGGAGFVAGTASVPTGRNANYKSIYIEALPTTEGACGHNHISEYVWGWRYNGSTFSPEFIGSTVRSGYWSNNTCTLKGAGHPNYNSDFARGDGTIRVPNSPYAVVWIAVQANSHRSAGCGQHGCYHDAGFEVSFN